MKKSLLLIFTLFFAVSLSFAQVYVFEPFDYAPTGATLLNNGHINPVTNTLWKDRQGGTVDMFVEADPGWAISQAFDLNPTGNAVHFQGGGEDGVLPFASPLNSGNSGPGSSVYLSFFLDVVGWDATATNNPADYRLIHFGVDNGTGGYNAGSALYVGPGLSGGNTFRLGYSNADTDVAWFGTDYTFTDLGDGGAGGVFQNQFFIVIKYTFGVGGGAPDGRMWINPAVNTTEPAANVLHTATSKIRSEFVAINLEASSDDRTPDCYFDEIRVAGSWEEATGQPALSVAKNNIEGLKVYPNPAKDYITIESKNAKLTSVELYNVLGAKVISSKSLTNDRLNVSGISKGIYMLKVNAEGASSTRKIVIE